MWNNGFYNFFKAKITVRAKLKTLACTLSGVGAQVRSRIEGVDNIFSNPLGWTDND